MTYQAGNNQMESGFRIRSLILLESSFKRVPNVTFIAEGIIPNINVDVNVDVEERTIFVTEKILYVQSCNNVEEVSCTIAMVGVFEKIGDSKLEDLKKFGQINGAAIIFPYIREHLSNLLLKAGIGSIILPPLDFTK